VLALRANLEVLQKAHNLAPFVDAIRSPFQRASAYNVEHVDLIVSPFMQPMYYAGKDVRGDVVPLHGLGRCGDPGGLPHMPNLAGVWNV
jgi:hypothetical protein